MKKARQDQADGKERAAHLMSKVRFDVMSETYDEEGMKKLRERLTQEGGAL
jgi:hypothetical protein